MTRNRFVMVILVLTTIAAAGCNMISGAGKDVEKAGETVQDAADRNK
jgi:predicted small secreted protein